MSQDPAMIKAYMEGKDLYAVIAQSMYNNKYEDNLEFYPEGTELELDGKKIICGKKTHTNAEGKARRSSAKTMLLAILYGMSASTAGKRMGKTAKEGQELMDNFFQKFPKVKKLLEDSRAFLKKNGYVEDWAGRRRHLPDYFLDPYEITYKDEAQVIENTFNPFLGCEDRVYTDAKMQSFLSRAQRTRNNQEFDKLAVEALKAGYVLSANTGRIAQAERQCLNARIQGGAASLTKLAMVNITNDEQLRAMMAELIITVHDEVLVECPEFYAEEVEKRLPQVMIDTAKPYINVPMACDPYNVTRWYATEGANLLRKEYKKIEKAHHELTKDQVVDLMAAEHVEYTRECIFKAVSSSDDIEL